MYPFRLNGSYLVIFCHMYTTHSRLNVSKSSYRIIISSQMGYIWPWTHAIHSCLAFFIVVLLELNVEYQNNMFSKETKSIRLIKSTDEWPRGKADGLWQKLPLSKPSPAPIFLIILRNIFDAWEKSCWLLKEILLRVKRPDVGKLDRWLLRDSGSHFVKRCS